jgi:hypothetical protein
MIPFPLSGFEQPGHWEKVRRKRRAWWKVPSLSQQRNRGYDFRREYRFESLIFILASLYTDCWCLCNRTQYGKPPRYRSEEWFSKGQSKIQSADSPAVLQWCRSYFPAAWTIRVMRGSSTVEWGRAGPLGVQLRWHQHLLLGNMVTFYEIGRLDGQYSWKMLKNIHQNQPQCWLSVINRMRLPAPTALTGHRLNESF